MGHNISIKNKMDLHNKTRQFVIVKMLCFMLILQHAKRIYNKKTEECSL